VQAPAPGCGFTTASIASKAREPDKAPFDERTAMKADQMLATYRASINLSTTAES